MSAPDTDVDKQAKRHAGPIIGISALLVFVSILLVVYFYYVAAPEDEALDLAPNSEVLVTDEEAIVTPEGAATEPETETLPNVGTVPTEAPAD